MKVHEDYNLHLRAMRAGEISYLNAPVLIYNCHRSPERMNVSLRPYWFATSALNHAIYRSLFDAPSVKEQQRFNQYQHAARALREGAAPEVLAGLVFAWWNALAQALLPDEIRLEFPIIQKLCPSLVPLLNDWEGPQ